MSAQSQARDMAAGGQMPEREFASPGEAVGASSTAAISALTERELSGMFYSPIAYIVGFIFLFLTGLFFTTETLQAGNEATMRSLFERIASLLVFALPLLTMRSVADEFATGAIETLMTAPVTDLSVILGKFLGVMLFYIALLATTLPHLILMRIYATPVGSVTLGGYLGLILLGAMFISVGIFASCCTRHQLLSAVIAAAILSIFTFAANYGTEYAPLDWERKVCSYLDVMGHFSDFGKGMLDSASIIFFLSNTVLFLFLAVKVLESRRWR
jgi:ABC-2 type transport system permease protein